MVNRKLGKASLLPRVSVIEISTIDKDGELVGHPTLWRGEHPSPKIYFSSIKLGTKTFTIGDKVLARISIKNEEYLAHPIKVLPSKPKQIIGIIEKDRSNFIIRSCDFKDRHKWPLKNKPIINVETGDLVVAKINKQEPASLSQAEIVRRLGKLNNANHFSEISIEKYQIRSLFPKEVISQAEECCLEFSNNREDLRKLPFVTIDGSDARDFDDAVFAEPSNAPPQGWHIIVAIADVSYFVKSGSPVDIEAKKRGNSTYFPDRVIPMLPEKLSNDLCSLNPGIERACIAVHLYISSTGILKKYKFTRAIIISAARLTYEQVQKAIDGNVDSTTKPLISESISPLYGAYRALAKARQNRCPLELNMPERKVLVNGLGWPTSIVEVERYDSHRLIEEYMITANIAAANAISNGKNTNIFRTHAKPDSKKIKELNTALGILGYKAKIKYNASTKDFRDLILQAGRGNELGLIDKLILRTQMQAEYNPINTGHFGLALPSYTHFTSPIRRYADLMVHRSLIKTFGLESNLSESQESENSNISTHLSKTERRSQNAERDSVKRYSSALLTKYIGKKFNGIVSGVARFGIFVELQETGTDGLIPLRTLGNIRLRYDARKNQINYKNFSISVGDHVKVKLIEVDILTGGLILYMKELNSKSWPYT